MVKRNKKQPNPQSVPSRKEPPKRLPGLPGSDSSGDRLCWRFKHFDHDGPWGFSKMTVAEVCGLMQELAKFETMKVSEAFNGSGHPGKDYEVAEIPTAEARDRLEAISLADMTKISRLRIGGTGRLYGFRCDNVFHVVWWDPEHEVWPSTLRNT